MRLLVVLLCILLCAPPAIAQGDAAALVKRAQSAYRERDYQRAAELFEKAHALDPVASLKVNAAQAWRLAGDLPRAADAYAAALATDGLAREERAFARDKLADIEKRVAIVRIDEPRGATISIAHAERVPIPATVRLMPGSHQLVIDDQGKKVTRTLELAAGETRTVSVLSSVRVAPPAPTPAPAPAATPSPEPPPKNGLPPVRIAGWVTLALGIALGGVTTYLGIRTLDAADRWKDSGLADLDARDEAVTFKTATNVTLAVAIAAGAAGILMLVIPIDDSDTARLDARGIGLAF